MTSASSKNSSFLRPLMLRTRRAFVYVGLFSLCLNILMLGLPLYSLQVLDRVMSSHNLNTLIMLTILAGGAFVFFGIFTAVRAFILSRIGEWLEVQLAPLLLASAVSKSSLGIPVSAGQHHRDLVTIKNFIAGTGITTLFDAPWAIIFLLVIYFINPVLGFITLVGAVLLIGFAVITELATKKPLEEANKVLIKGYTISDTASRNAEAIEAMGMLPNIISNWKVHNTRNLELQSIASSRSTLLMCISRIIRLSLQIAVVGAGAFLALQNDMTMGGMIAASILAGRALAPFEAAIAVWKGLLSARDAYSRLEKNVTALPDMRSSMELPPPTGRLEVENLVYRVPTGELPIIKGISFQLNAGQSLGIIGPSAAGKSTLAKLIIGVLPPSHGAVRLDGMDVFKWNREQLGKHVGYMPQDVELFNGTVKDNIARMEMDAPPEKVIHAAQRAGVHEMILRLPKGYDTEFSTTNISLSPGQRQRIGLARALYGDPKFIVLDEPNGNLDGDGEKALVQALFRLKQDGLTFVVVAHRPSIVSSVDMVMMLRDGQIESFGPREDVLRKYTATPAATVQKKAAAVRGNPS